MLVQHGWDAEKAYEALRQKGLAAVAKKASRHAAEGLVGASYRPAAAAAAATTSDASSAAAGGAGGSVVVVELNSETDFVARNGLFQDLLRSVLDAAHGLGPGAAAPGGHELRMEQLLAARTPGGAAVGEAVTAVAAAVRENVRLRRAYRVDAADGHVASYVHQPMAPGLGKLAAVVLLRPGAAGQALPASGPGAEALSAAASGLAMHVAGMRPAHLDRRSVPPAELERQRSELRAVVEQDKAFTGKPAQVLSKVVEGRLGKALAESCLLEQRYVLEEEASVGEVVRRLGGTAGGPVAVSSFLRVQCGEGVAAREGGGGGDFAAEVARIVSEAQ